MPWAANCLAMTSRHQLILQRHDAGLAVEHVHVGAEMGEDGSALAAGVPCADDRDAAGKGFQPPDVVRSNGELGAGKPRHARMAADADDQAAIAFHGHAISEGDGGR